jgi:hypothetical protein
VPYALQLSQFRGGLCLPRGLEAAAIGCAHLLSVRLHAGEHLLGGASGCKANNTDLDQKGVNPAGGIAAPGGRAGRRGGARAPPLLPLSAGSGPAVARTHDVIRRVGERVAPRLGGGLGQGATLHRSGRARDNRAGQAGEHHRLGVPASVDNDELDERCVREDPQCHIDPQRLLEDQEQITNVYSCIMLTDIHYFEENKKRSLLM